MAKAPDLTFTLSLASVQVLRQVGEALERVNASVQDLMLSVEALDDELEMLNDHNARMERARGAS
jgi:prefoldin subunit 5